MAAFEKQKVACLSQVDLSKKGSIDDQIKNLVQYINAKENFFTTSSCSGRISIFSELADQKKKQCEWLYVTHDAAIKEEVINSLKDCKGSAVFKFEPFVLHVQCRNLECGQQMLKAALISGFKNSGIVIGRKANVIVAVRSTQSLEVPLVHLGEQMVSHKYVEFLVDIANNKLEDNQTRIDRFFKNLKDVLHNHSLSDSTSQKTDPKQTTDTRKDELFTEVTRTSQKSNADDFVHLNDNDVLDCLASFYGDVS